MFNLAIGTDLKMFWQTKVPPVAGSQECFSIKWTDTRNTVTQNIWWIKRPQRERIDWTVFFYLYGHTAISCLHDSFWCNCPGKWTDIQPLKWVGSSRWCTSAHPIALGQYYSIIQRMKRTLVTLLSITHVSLPHFSPSLFLSAAFTHWHVVMCRHPEWWPLHTKYRLFITIPTGQAGTKLKSWTLLVSITHRDKTKAP